MFDLIYKSSCSLCFEWKNDRPYDQDKPYTVRIGDHYTMTSNTNVFSIFGLKPDTKYKIEVLNTPYDMTVTTEAETACFDASDFGALGDGESDDTAAIQSAINCLPAGGRLHIRRGCYLVAPLCLKSNMTLELEEGAVLLGSPDQRRYPIIPGEIEDMVTHEKHQVGTWEGNPVPMHQALIFAEHAENVHIIGPGTIDGNAQNGKWWEKLNERTIARPRLVFLNQCKNVHFHGITGQNSASWQFHPYFSQNIDFLDIKINAPKDSPNTDAIDPEACDEVRIIGCVFSVGDDCIAIKSGKMYIGQKYQTPADHHTIRNCLMQFGHGGVTLGSEIAGGVKNLTVNRCIFRATDRGLRIKTRRGRGKYSVVDDILFENIQMDNVLTPIVINMWYNCCDDDRNSEYNTTREKLPIDDRTPYLGKFCFRNMECLNCHIAACYCDGLPEQPIKEVKLEHIHVTYNSSAKAGIPAMQNIVERLCNAGIYLKNVQMISVEDVRLDGVRGEMLVTENVGEVDLCNA